MIHILPLAEKITADNLYPAQSEKKLPSVKIPPAVYTVLAVIALIAVYTHHFFGIILTGALFLTAGADSRTGAFKKGRTIEKVLWIRLPMFLIGFLKLLAYMFIISLPLWGKWLLN